MELPKNLPWERANSQWASIINPILANPILGGYQINGISLSIGVPLVVNHTLGQVPQGWFQINKNAFGDVISTWSTTQTLTLEANADVKISIWIY